MKNIFFSFIILPIALIFSAQFSNLSVPKGNPITDTLEVIDLRMSTTYDCCTGDIEDPIIRGLVENNANQPIVGATVEVFESGNPTALGSTTTDSNGDFAVRVSPGSYYFEITPIGCSTSTTSPYTVNDDIDITITI